MSYRSKLYPQYKANRAGAGYKLTTINVHINKSDTIVVSPQPRDRNGVYQDLGMRFNMQLGNHSQRRIINCVVQFCHRFKVKAKQIQVYTELEIGTRPDVILFRQEWLQ